MYKNRLLSALLSEEDTVNVLNMNGQSYSSQSSLLYTQVFPYLYIDETQTSVLPYICCDINPNGYRNDNMKSVSLRIWVYANRDCMKCKAKGYTGTRVDILCDLVDRTIHQLHNEIGIGTAELISSETLFPQRKFYGRELVYTIHDFRLKGIANATT